MKQRLSVLVTGASRGIGHALARELAARGHEVFGTSRSWPAASAEDDFFRLEVDVTEDQSVSAAVEQILSKSGRIDVLVNNAGVSLSGPVEETPLPAARDVFEANYFGMSRLIGAVLPHMRARGSGTIVNVGSAAGKIGIPFQGHYAASKFAVEGLSEALSLELSPLGIRVLLIEPGDVKTDIWSQSRHVLPDGSPYTAMLERFHEVKCREMGDGADAPESVARAMARIIESDTRRLRHPVARMAGPLLLARKLLPDGFFLWALARNYRLSG